MTAGLHEQLTDAPVGELLTEGDGTGLVRAAAEDSRVQQTTVQSVLPVQFADAVEVEYRCHGARVAIEEILIVPIIPVQRTCLHREVSSSPL